MKKTESKNKVLYCTSLPTKPKKKIGKILVTGASGYIGGRLTPELIARGYKVRIMVRAFSSEYKRQWPKAEIVVADAFNKKSLKKALDGIDTAYYLIHSLLLGPKKFALSEIVAARNFREVAEEKKVKRIIYLGGSGDKNTKLSSHLKSRIKIAETLQAGKIPVTFLKAAVIIGAGGASYELIRSLVKIMPFLLIPHWAKNKIQPIGVSDVIKYLVGVLETPRTSGKLFDIGGKDILTYELMLKIMAEMLKTKVLFIPFFFSYIPLYSYVASFITPLPTPITVCLMEGLKNEVVCLNNTIKKYIPLKLLSYKESIIIALNREEQDNIYTRWTGAYPPACELAMKLHEMKDSDKYKKFIIKYSVTTLKTAPALFYSISHIGGKYGWFRLNWVWELKGLVDRIFLGVGLARGRQRKNSLRINDVIDFWRIEDVQQNARLLIRSEMKQPKKAWLEFKIKDKGKKRELSVIFYYYTRSIFGRLYWNIFLPFHRLVFNDLIIQIEKKS